MAEHVEREMVLPASPDVVWRAVTDESWLSQWLAEAVTLDLTPGGEARFLVDDEWRSGWVEDVQEPGRDQAGRLSFWWQGVDEPASRVEIELVGADGGTRLRIVEARPLEILDLTGIPLGGTGQRFGPALAAV